MAGLIATRAQLREYLERARGKRHRVNSGRILLIHSDMDSLSGYSDLLGELITSHLLSGREPEKQVHEEEYDCPIWTSILCRATSLTSPSPIWRSLNRMCQLYPTRLLYLMCNTHSLQRRRWTTPRSLRM